MFGLASAVVVPLALIACNGILGLDAYDRVECTGLVCDGGAPSDGAPPRDAMSTDAATEAGRGADPVSWARWPMPNYVLVDASPLPRPPSLTVNDDGTVTDGVTKLVWRRTLEGGAAPTKYEGAQSACRNLSPSGQWRLPKRIELVTLLDYGHDKPFIDTSRFTDFPPTRVWTSSEARPFTGAANQQYWTVNFDTGAVELQNGAQAAAATLCVKAR